MNTSFLDYGQIISAASLIVGMLVMANGMIVESYLKFKTALYAFLASGLTSAFLYVLKYGLIQITDTSEIPLESMSNGANIPLGVGIAVLVIVSVFGLAYYYIHNFLPQFFVRATLFFSAMVCIMIIGNTLPDKQKGTGKLEGHKFIESSAYSLEKEKKETKLVMLESNKQSTP
jgi:hypothetical protein